MRSVPWVDTAMRFASINAFMDMSLSSIAAKIFMNIEQRPFYSVMGE
jgi:hypothetical protein